MSNLLMLRTLCCAALGVAVAMLASFSAVGLAEDPGLADDAADLKFEIHEATASSHAASITATPVKLAADAPLTLSVAVAADGTRVTAVDARGAVRQWRLPDGEPTGLREGGAENLACAALSPDGEQLAVVTAEGELLISAVASQETPRRLEISGGRTVAIKFSADSKFLVGATSDGWAHVWDMETFRRRDLDTSCKGAVQMLAISPDSSKLAIATATGPVRLIDFAKHGSTQASLRTEPAAMALAFSPDGRSLALGGADGAVRVWDLSSGKISCVMTGHTFGVWAVAFSQRGETLASASWDGAIRLWDDSGRELARQKAHSESVTSLTFAPAAGGLVSAGLDGRLLFWPADAPRFAPWATLSGHPGQAWVAVFSPDGNTLLTGGGNNGLALWDIRRRELIAKLEGHETTRCAAFSRDGAQFATGGSDGKIWLWEARSGKKQHVLGSHPSAVSAVVYSPDGAVLASACDGKVIKLWDLSPRKEKAVWQGCQEQIYCASFSPDGRWLATGGGNWTSEVPGELRLWDIGDGSSVSLPGHRLSIWTVAFSPDGNTLATSSSDGTVKIWDLATRSIEKTLAYDIWLRPLDFSPDGKLLAVGRGDGPVRLWDAENWQELASLEGHEGFTFALKYSPDGKTIATAGSDGTVKLWSPLPAP